MERNLLIFEIEMQLRNINIIAHHVVLDGARHELVCDGLQRVVLLKGVALVADFYYESVPLSGPAQFVIWILDEMRVKCWVKA
jgi:hypothetical protein